MENNERIPLLRQLSVNITDKQLTLFFAVACIVDQFGVNPIIVLPRAIILCGWVGYPLAVFVFLITIYTAMLLGRCWVIAEHLNDQMHSKSRFPYSALSKMAWGETAGKIINVLLNILVFGSNIPPLVIAAQNLQTFDAKISNFTFNFSYCYWLIILGIAVCPLTWLGSPKDTKWISVTSAFSVLTCAILTWVCMLTDNTKSTVYSDVPAPNWQSVGIGFGILAFQFGCHPAILTIQTDMNNKTQLSQSVLFSFFTTGSLSIITICLASLLYGSGIHANLAQGLPASPTMYIDILVVTLQLFLSTVVGGCSLFQDIEDKLGVPRELCWQRCVIRTTIVMLLVLIGEMLPRFDLVMGLLGGLLTGPLTLMFPPLLYRKFRNMLAQQKNQKENERLMQTTEETCLLIPVTQEKGGQPNPFWVFNKSKRRLNFQQFLKKHFFSLEINLDEGELSVLESFIVFGIFGLGIAATVTATYYSLRGAVWSTQFLPPCIFDVKAASNIINT